MSHPSVSLDISLFNRLSPSDLAQKFARISSCKNWCQKMVAGAPYANATALTDAASKNWWNECSRSDWIEGFAGRPLIGDKKSFEADLYCAAEDEHVIKAEQKVADELIACNGPYTKKFGMVWILLCEGLTPEQQLANYRRRIQNDVDAEMMENCVEELKIIIRRLTLCLESRDPYDVPSELESKIRAGNAEVIRRLNASETVLVDVARAGDVIPGLGKRMVLHSGPPITWEKMCGAQKGAVIGMVLFEGWAATDKEAIAMLEKGEIQVEPNHHHQTVGSMAGAISPSLPVWVVENRAPGAGNRAFCGIVDSRQTFGEYTPEVLADLVEWRDVFAPAIAMGVKAAGGIPLKDLIARSLQMGDGLHSRAVAASALLANVLSAPMVQAGVEKSVLLRTIKFCSNHRLNFLSLSMSSAKAMTDFAMNVPYSTVVTAMARNGVEFGIRVSGLGDEWFTAEAPRAFMQFFVPKGKAAQPWDEGFGLVPIKSDKDVERWTIDFAGRDMGDSAITETVGWGATLLANQLGFLPIVGCSLDRAMVMTKELRQLSVASSSNYAIPIYEFEGGPLGIDIRRVVSTGLLPLIDTGIAHKEPNNSIVGSGLARPPMECFKKALAKFEEKYGKL